MALPIRPYKKHRYLVPHSPLTISQLLAALEDYHQISLFSIIDELLLSLHIGIVCLEFGFVLGIERDEKKAIGETHGLLSISNVCLCSSGKLYAFLPASRPLNNENPPLGIVFLWRVAY
jgi:hypothetical protein